MAFFSPPLTHLPSFILSFSLSLPSSTTIDTFTRETVSEAFISGPLSCPQKWNSKSPNPNILSYGSSFVCVTMEWRPNMLSWWWWVGEWELNTGQDTWPIFKWGGALMYVCTPSLVKPAHPVIMMRMMANWESFFPHPRRPRTPLHNEDNNTVTDDGHWRAFFGQMKDYDCSHAPLTYYWWCKACPESCLRLDLNGRGCLSVRLSLVRMVQICILYGPRHPPIWMSEC